MTISRRLKRLISELLIGVLLFAQMAVAAYACPTQAELNHPTSAMSEGGANALDSAATVDDSAKPDDVAMTAMADCDHMASVSDQESPNLCVEHCHRTQQSHQIQLPNVPAIVLVSLYVVEPLLDRASAGPAIADFIQIPAATSPPHAILHCSFQV